MTKKPILLVLFAVLITISACSSDDNDDDSNDIIMPAEMVGIWETSRMVSEQPISVFFSVDTDGSAVDYYYFTPGFFLSSACYAPHSYRIKPLDDNTYEVTYQDGSTDTITVTTQETDVFATFAGSGDTFNIVKSNLNKSDLTPLCDFSFDELLAGNGTGTVDNPPGTGDIGTTPITINLSDLVGVWEASVPVVNAASYIAIRGDSSAKEFLPLGDCYATSSYSVQVPGDNTFSFVYSDGTIESFTVTQQGLTLLLTDDLGNTLELNPSMLLEADLTPECA